MPDTEAPRNLPAPLPDAAPAGASRQEQLDRLEAKLDRNARLLRICIGLLAVLIAAVCIGLGLLFYHGGVAYQNLLQACEQVDTLAGTIQQSLDSMEPGELDRLLQSLPEIADRLSELDTDALNEVISQLPAMVQSLQELQEQMSRISDWVSGFGSLFR